MRMKMKMKKKRKKKIHNIEEMLLLFQIENNNRCFGVSNLSFKRAVVFISFSKICFVL